MSASDRYVRVCLCRGEEIGEWAREGAVCGCEGGVDRRVGYQLPFGMLE